MTSLKPFLLYRCHRAMTDVTSCGSVLPKNYKIYTAFFLLISNRQLNLLHLFTEQSVVIESDAVLILSLSIFFVKTILHFKRRFRLMTLTFNVNRNSTFCILLVLFLIFNEQFRNHFSVGFHPALCIS